ncbi:unnamed protein product [Gordionus sp. m RMFG-2023]
MKHLTNKSKYDNQNISILNTRHVELEVALPFLYLNKLPNHECNFTKLDPDIHSMMIKGIKDAIDIKENLDRKNQNKVIIQLFDENNLNNMYITLKYDNIKLLTPLGKIFSNHDHFYIRVSYDVFQFCLPQICDVLFGKVINIYNLNKTTDDQKYATCCIMESSVNAIIRLSSNIDQSFISPNKKKKKIIHNNNNFDNLKIGNTISFIVTSIEYDKQSLEFYMLKGDALHII